MNSYPSPYAGLILPDANLADLLPYMEAAETALLKHDPSDNGASRLMRKTTVVGRDYAVRIRYQEISDYGPRVLLQVVTRKGVELCEEKASRILSDSVLHALTSSPSDIIEWCAPDVLLDSDDFIRLRSYVSPMRFGDFASSEEMEVAASFRCGLDEAEAVEDDARRKDRIGDLKERVQDMEPADFRMTAASAAMTALIAVVSLPIAAAVAIINLGKGFDLRLTTQALSVTALFVGLHQGFGVENLVTMVLN